MKKFGVFLLLLYILSSTCFAGGVTIYGQVKDQENVNYLTPGSSVEVVRSDNGALVAATTIGNYGWIKDSNGLFISGSNYSVRVYAYNGPDKDTVLGGKGYYGYSSSISLGSTMDLPRDVTANFNTNYKADVPPPPVTTQVSNFSFSYNGETWVPSFRVQGSYGTGYQVENVTWEHLITSEGGNFTSAKRYRGNPVTVDNDPFYLANGRYQVMSIASDPFGSTNGSTSTFTIPTYLPPAGGESQFTFYLKAFNANRLVVNSISLPPTMTSITKASQLIDYINSKAGKNIVIALGKWDPVTGTAVGLKPDGEGTNFDLKPGEGYQLYVSEDFTLTLP